MFKFNCDAEGDNAPNPSELSAAPQIPELPGNEVPFDECLLQERVDAELYEQYRFGETLLKKCVKQGHLVDSQHNAELVRSDLVPGVYEGGFKLWECAISLIEYVQQEKLQLSQQRVLELGCGHALPSIYALLCGAEVTMQDYVSESLLLAFDKLFWQNHEVLRDVTQRNVLLNGAELLARSRFVAGDWAHMHGLVGAGTYDVIFSSDTIYDTRNYAKLIALVQHALSPHGIALFAAKTYYFGVGGSVSVFVDQLQRSGLKCELVQRTVDAASNIREVLRISKQSSVLE
jgi:predicted nicotinamide N-methyase